MKKWMKKALLGKEQGAAGSQKESLQMEGVCEKHNASQQMTHGTVTVYQALRQMLGHSIKHARAPVLEGGILVHLLLILIDPRN